MDHRSGQGSNVCLLGSGKMGEEEELVTTQEIKEEVVELSVEDKKDYQETLDVILQDNDEFRTKLDHFKGIGLTSKDSNGESDPYIKGSFDNFRTFKSEAIDKTLNPVWSEFDLKFEYLTKYPDCLRVKKLELEIWDKDKLAKDDLIGKCSVDLYTLATGPKDHELQLFEDEAKTIPAGTLHFAVLFDHICPVHISLGNVRISDMTYGESGGDNAPSAYLSYNTANLNSGTHYKTDTLPPTFTPSFDKLPIMKPKFTLREFLADGLELKLRHEKTGLDPLLGKVTFAFKKYFGNEPPKENYWYQFKEDLEDDKHQKSGLIEGFFGISGLPKIAGMDGGVHNDSGCHKGTPFFKHLPLPDNWQDN